MLVFDTATVPERDRADAVSSAMLDATLTTDLAHHDPERVHLRIDTYGLGAVELTHVTTSGMDTTRTPRQTASDEEPVVALSLGTTRTGVIEQDGEQVGTRIGAVNLVELTRPYFSRIPHGTDGWSVKIPLAALSLREGTIRTARTSLFSSPLHRLFADHLGGLGLAAADLDVGSAALTGTGTAAGPDDPQAREALADTLVARVQAYVRAHLADPHLSPATIAAAHHVSERHLYRSFAEAGLSLEQWVIGTRLEAARRDLARPESCRRTIASIGRAWGFVNASHFSQRFREEYGVTPREWQRDGR